jgi:zinc finger protein 830
VKKLREKREMLRAGKTDQAIEDAKVAVVGADGRGALDEIVRSVQPEQKSEINGEEGEDDDDDDDEELDDWTFGAR